MNKRELSHKRDVLRKASMKRRWMCCRISCKCGAPPLSSWIQTPKGILGQEFKNIGTFWCVDTGAAVVKWSIYMLSRNFSPHTYSWAFKLTNHLIQTGPSECYWVLAPLSLIIYFGVIQGNCEPVHDVFSSSVWAVLDTTIGIPHVDFIILVKQLNHPRFILLFTYWWKNVVP